MIRVGRAEIPPSTQPVVPRQRIESPRRADHAEQRGPTTATDLGLPDAQAREAMEFYAAVLGGELDAVTFGDDVSVSLSGGPEDAERLREWFAGLAEGGVVRQPLGAAPGGDELGMLTDRFGIDWRVNIAGASS